jgi:hypothetical protein
VKGKEGREGKGKREEEETVPCHHKDSTARCSGRFFCKVSRAG